MKIDTPSDTLITITVDKQGLITMIDAASAAITYANEWNFGDEFDIDITPYHEMKDALSKKYKEVFGEDLEVSDENYEE